MRTFSDDMIGLVSITLLSTVADNNMIGLR